MLLTAWLLTVGQKLCLKKEAKVTGRHGLQVGTRELRESRDLLAFGNLTGNGRNGTVETVVFIEWC